MEHKAYDEYNMDIELVRMFQTAGDKVREKIPGLFLSTHIEPFKHPENDKTYVYLKFMGADNKYCQEFIKFLYSITKDDLTHTHLSQIHKSLAISFSLDELRKLRPEQINAIQHRLLPLLQLSKVELQQRFDVLSHQSFESIKHAPPVSQEISSSDEDILKDPSDALLKEMKKFIKKAGCTCKVNLSHEDPTKAEFKFDGGTEDAVQVAGTIALKLITLGSVTLECEKAPHEKCSIVLIQNELYDAPERELTKVKRSFANVRKTPESLRKEIEKFDILKHYYLIDGNPPPFERSK